MTAHQHCAHGGAPCPRLMVKRQADRRQAQRRKPERVTWWRIVGLTAFVLWIFFVGMYAAPIVLHGLAGS